MSVSNEQIKIHFLGGAETVTGSKFLIETHESTIMIDCGLFQGLKKLRQKNWEYLPIPVEKIDVVLLTHAHLDHTGFLPRLVKMGFKGEVWGTEPTLDIAEIILRDSAHIQEEQADRANRERYTSHSPARPLYSTEDVEKTIPYFRSRSMDEWHRVSDHIRVRFRYAGHIIGACFLELDITGQRLVFSGDVGRPDDVLMRAPERPEKADYLFIESTYGNRVHRAEVPEQRLAELINETVSGGGTFIIPSFAVERAQTLMLILWRLQKEGSIPKIPLILDSPMGASVLDVFKRFREWHKLQIAECDPMCNTFVVNRHFKDTLESINNDEPKVVIAGSGMVSGGRVLNYLEKYIGLPSSTILLAGFQAEGTRGRALLENASEVKIFGNYYQVKARIEHMNALSSHADQAELLDWVGDLDSPPKTTFIIHGESAASDAFRVKIEHELGWHCMVPDLYEIIELSDES